ncbi:uncharacterized protein LOC121857080 [Homarus americanus]|uniref:uncharacterized protein LOC121857080 n=1 Tax=Homarus americanus TaxID=6706 RepID=UPI001C43A3C1|nr:uncharacterized protein LOC121857080 [Homarus americanus]
MADVEVMYHQIHVAPEHRDALRFLWWENGGLSSEPVTYRMKVHIFGGVWSPSCATYSLRRTFQDHRSEFPDMVAQAEVNFYVDYLLMSLDSSNEASMLACQLRRLLACGGFRLTKWASNHKGVLVTIPPEERQNALKEIDLSQDKLPMERALGVRSCTTAVPVVRWHVIKRSIAGLDPRRIADLRFKISSAAGYLRNR